MLDDWLGPYLTGVTTLDRVAQLDLTQPLHALLSWEQQRQLERWAPTHLTVPSGSQTGLKVNFSPPITVTEGQTVLLVDFDVSQSFVFQGPSDHPNSISFKPVLHATAMDVAASISGTVTPVTANATVYAIAGTDTAATAFPNATTGAYTLRFLAPGAYVVAAKATGFAVAVSASLTLGNSEAKTGVNLVLVAAP